MRCFNSATAHNGDLTSSNFYEYRTIFVYEFVEILMIKFVLFPASPTAVGMVVTSYWQLKVSCLEQSCLCIYCDHFYDIVNSVIKQKDSPNGYRRRKPIPKCLNASCERRILNRTYSIPKVYSILKKILCICISF